MLIFVLNFYIEPKKNWYERPPTRSGSDKKVEEEPETAVSKQGKYMYFLRISKFNRSWRGVLHTTSCDKVCQWLATGQWFSPGTLVCSAKKTVRHNITNTINQPNQRTIKMLNILY